MRNRELNVVQTTFGNRMLKEQGRLLRVDTVHPLLCGIGGPVTVLPDHPHEGEVYDSVNIDVVDPNEVEYHRVNGTGPGPQVVAKARSGMPFNYHGPSWKYEGDLDSNGNYDITNAVIGRDFAAIGAYDGQQVGVGRIVVDSSLHHWLDLNLEGLDQDHLAQIQTYHLNVAT